MVQINISINLPLGEPEPSSVGIGLPTANGPQHDSLSKLRQDHQELVAQMGDEIGPFPDAKVGGYMSHFRFTMRFDVPPLRGKALSVVSPPAAQSVAWSAPFVYEGPGANHRARIPVPARSTLPNVLAEEDFFVRPPEFFEKGKETLWLQILNLDARMDSEIGPMRIILGETLKAAHPDIFKPSLGIAQSLGRRGFPAKLFFNPYAVIETTIGSFRAIHGTLSYGRVTGFPPLGTPVTIRDQVPIEELDSVKEAVRTHDSSKIREVGRIVALTHPIDMEIHEKGEGAYDFVNALIQAAGPGPHVPRPRKRRTGK